MMPMLKSGLRKDQKDSNGGSLHPDDYGVGNLRWPELSRGVAIRQALDSSWCLLVRALSLIPLNGVIPGLGSGCRDQSECDG